MADQADDARLRHLALQVALQLPRDPAEALVVLDLAAELVRGFLSEKCGPEGEPAPPPPPLRLL